MIAMFFKVSECAHDIISHVIFLSEHMHKYPYICTNSQTHKRPRTHRITRLYESIIASSKMWLKVSQSCSSLTHQPEEVKWFAILLATLLIAIQMSCRFISIWHPYHELLLRFLPLSLLCIFPFRSDDYNIVTSCRIFQRYYISSFLKRVMSLLPFPNPKSRHSSPITL